MISVRDAVTGAVLVCRGIQHTSSAANFNTAVKGASSGTLNLQVHAGAFEPCSMTQISIDGASSTRLALGCNCCV